MTAFDGRRISELSREERFRYALTELGTTFIKLGQVLSTRSDLIPPELADEFRKLQSDAPKVDFVAIRKRLDEEFDGRTDELFESIEEAPMDDPLARGKELTSGCRWGCLYAFVAF